MPTLYRSRCAKIADHLFANLYQAPLIGFGKIPMGAGNKNIFSALGLRQAVTHTALNICGVTE